MSELDPERRRSLLNIVEGWEQVIVTATELSPFPDRFLEQSTLLQVEQGSIQAIPPHGGL